MGTLQDLRLGVRALGRTRGYTVVVLLTLSVAIGADTAIYQPRPRRDARALPYADPGRLVSISVDAD